MKVQVKNGKSCEKILKIEVDPKVVQKEFDTFYSSLAPKAKVPGFRPGKAPRDVLAMHYREEAHKNVLNQLIQDTYRQAVKEEDLDVLGYPEVDEVDFAEDKLSYRVQLEVRPKFKLSKVEGLQVKKESSEVKPEDLEESLRRIQKSQAQYKTVEGRAAAKNDFVVADFVCKVGEVEVDKRTEDWLQIKEEEYLKGFSIQLVGMNAGEERDVKVALPENFWRKEYQGKDAVFHVKLREIKEEILPKLDDELAKSVGDYASLSALKEKVQSELKVAKDRQVETNYEKALLDELMKNNKITLPEGLVARRLERLCHDALRKYENHGFPKDKMEELTKDLRKDLEPEARRQIHLAFLLDQIATEHELVAAEADLENRFTEVAAQVRQDVDLVRKYYSENNEARLGLMEEIRSEKAVQYIKSHAKTK